MENVKTVKIPPFFLILILFLIAGTCFVLFKPEFKSTLIFKQNNLELYQETQIKEISPAILMIPGGGYQGIAKSGGMVDLDWLQTNKVKVFYVKYTLGDYPTSLNDVNSAWVYLFQNAERLKIDSNKIGVYGASVGGHLAAHIIGRSQLRPAVAILQYPLITMSITNLINPQCLQNLAGKRPITLDLMKEMSAESYFNPKTMPPCFIVHNVNDSVVSADNSMLLVKPLVAGGIPFELHFYRSPKGEHDTDNPPQWTENCVRFLKIINFIK